MEIHRDIMPSLFQECEDVEESLKKHTVTLETLTLQLQDYVSDVHNSAHFFEHYLDHYFTEDSNKDKSLCNLITNKDTEWNIIIRKLRYENEVAFQRVVQLEHENHELRSMLENVKEMLTKQQIELFELRHENKHFIHVIGMSQKKHFRTVQKFSFYKEIFRLKRRNKKMQIKNNILKHILAKQQENYRKFLEYVFLGILFLHFKSFEAIEHKSKLKSIMSQQESDILQENILDFRNIVLLEENYKNEISAVRDMEYMSSFSHKISIEGFELKMIELSNSIIGAFSSDIDYDQRYEMKKLLIWSNVIEVMKSLKMKKSWLDLSISLPGKPYQNLNKEDHNNKMNDCFMHVQMENKEDVVTNTEKESPTLEISIGKEVKLEKIEELLWGKKIRLDLCEKKMKEKIGSVLEEVSTCVDSNKRLKIGHRVNAVMSDLESIISSLENLIPSNHDIKSSRREKDYEASGKNFINCSKLKSTLLKDHPILVTESLLETKKSKYDKTIKPLLNNKQPKFRKLAVAEKVDTPSKVSLSKTKKYHKSETEKASPRKSQLGKSKLHFNCKRSCKKSAVAQANKQKVETNEAKIVKGTCQSYEITVKKNIVSGTNHAFTSIQTNNPKVPIILIGHGSATSTEDKTFPYPSHSRPISKNEDFSFKNYEKVTNIFDLTRRQLKNKHEIKGFQKNNDFKNMPMKQDVERVKNIINNHISSKYFVNRSFGSQAESCLRKKAKELDEDIHLVRWESGFGSSAWRL